MTNTAMQAGHARGVTSLPLRAGLTGASRRQRPSVSGQHAQMRVCQQRARGIPAAGAQTWGRMDDLTEEQAQTIGELMDHLIEWVEDMADDGFTHGEAYSAITLFASAISQAQREVMN